MFGRLFHRRKASGSANPWDLGRRLLAFSKKDFLTVGNSCEGLLIMGATGSGKTSASGQAIALSFLNAGYGGIVFAAKGDEVRTWEHYCRVTGRSSDLIIFNPENPARFNVTDFEAKRKGRGAGLSVNLVQLLSTIADITNPASGGHGGQNDGQFWEDSKKQLLRNLIDLVLLAKGGIAMSDLHEVLSSAPRSIEESESASWQQRSYCYRCLKEAFQRPKSRIQERDFGVLDRYWMGTFPALADRTRSVIVSSYSAMKQAAGGEGDDGLDPALEDAFRQRQDPFEVWPAGIPRVVVEAAPLLYQGKQAGEEGQDDHHAHEPKQACVIVVRVAHRPAEHQSHRATGTRADGPAAEGAKVMKQKLDRVGGKQAAGQQPILRRALGAVLTLLLNHRSVLSCSCRADAAADHFCEKVQNR